MNQAVQEFIDAVPKGHRALFDRVHGLILEKHPDTEVRLSYKMPTYQVGERSLIVGVWKHGLSLYGWEFGRDGGFSGRHGDLMGAKGTLKLTEKAAAASTMTSWRRSSAPSSRRDQLPTSGGPRPGHGCGVAAGGDAERVCTPRH